MHATVDDVNFCDGLECVYVNYSHASTAHKLPVRLIHGSLPVKTWLLIAYDTAFCAIIVNISLLILINPFPASKDFCRLICYWSHRLLVLGILFFRLAHRFR